MQFNCHIYLHTQHVFSSYWPGILDPFGPTHCVAGDSRMSGVVREIKSSTLSPLCERKIIKTLETSCLIETLWTLKLLGSCHLSKLRRLLAVLCFSLKHSVVTVDGFEAFTSRFARALIHLCWKVFKLTTLWQMKLFSCNILLALCAI